LRARTLVVVAVTVLVAVAGCAGASTTTSDDPTVGAAATVQPADVSQATRTVEIKANDELKFNPTKVAAKPGETIAFKVVNPGKVDHEFVVGDGAFQARHEKEMQDMPAGHGMGDEPTAVTVKAGETKTIALTFPTAGSLVFACHQPGHYGAGMKGTINVA